MKSIIPIFSCRSEFSRATGKSDALNCKTRSRCTKHESPLTRLFCLGDDSEEVFGDDNQYSTDPATVQCLRPDPRLACPC